MLIIMRLMTHSLRGLKRPGLVTGVFLVWYAIARTICEFYREPERIHALNIEPFTAGQRIFCRCSCSGSTSSPPRKRDVSAEAAKA